LYAAERELRVHIASALPKQRAMERREEGPGDFKACCALHKITAGCAPDEHGFRPAFPPTSHVFDKSSVFRVAGWHEA
jgi:hypothetical protein